MATIKTVWTEESVPIEMIWGRKIFLHVISIFKIQEKNLINMPNFWSSKKGATQLSTNNKDKVFQKTFLDTWVGVSLYLSKSSEHILKLSPWHNSFHLVNLFQFLLGLLSALFFGSLLKFLLSHGCVHLIHEFIWSD